MCSSNNRALKYVEQTLTELKGETDSNTVTIDFSAPLSITYRITGEKTGNEAGLEQHYRRLH